MTAKRKQGFDRAVVGIMLALFAFWALVIGGIGWWLGWW